MLAWCQPAEFVDSKSSDDVSYLIFFALQFRFPSSVLLLVHVCGICGPSLRYSVGL